MRRAALSAVLALTLAAPAASAQAPALHCGDTVTASVRLDRDLRDCPGSGLVVGAPGITIDLGGHLVDGDGRDEGVDSGIDNSGHFADVRVRNGRISGFENAVKVGAFPSGPPSFETRNTIRGLSMTDVDAGVFLIRADGNDIERNRIDNGTGGLGIELLVASHNTIAGNRVTGAGNGMDLTASDDNRITGNAATGNAQGIAVLFNSTANRVVANLLVGNNVHGFYVAGGHDTRVERNIVASNLEDGMQVVVSTGTTLARNVVTGNGTEIHFDDGDGIFVDDASPGTVLERNAVARNHDDGIDARSAATFTSNIALGNGDLGIFAAPGATDGGGNRAAGNGNPAQCSGVSC